MGLPLRKGQSQKVSVKDSNCKVGLVNGQVETSEEDGGGGKKSCFKKFEWEHWGGFV